MALTRLQIVSITAGGALPILGGGLSSSSAGTSGTLSLAAGLVDGTGASVTVASGSQILPVTIDPMTQTAEVVYITALTAGQTASIACTRGAEPNGQSSTATAPAHSAGAVMRFGPTPVDINGALTYANLYGDGSDSAATLDGTATVSWASKASSVYTMTRDCFCTNLTINTGVTLIAAGFAVFCTGAYSNAGTHSANGNAGLAAGTAGANTGQGSLGGGLAGGAGNTGAGSAGTGNGATGACVGVGGGGAGGLGSSGAAGTAGFAQYSSAPWMVRSALVGISGAVNFSGAIRPLGGAPGGGGGGGDGTNHGGGGGSGGGAIVIFAHTINSSGSITATGGAGGTPTTGNCGGGGGGGGGLILLYSMTAWTNTGTTTVTGGALGSLVGTGANGVAGGNGTATNYVQV